MQKITKATFKSFIKKNVDKLLVCVESSFDSMEDCVTYRDNKVFKNVNFKDEFANEHVEHTLGIRGLWLVGHGGDYFKHYEDDKMEGIKVYNSCGSSIIAIAK